MSSPLEMTFLEDRGGCRFSRMLRAHPWRAVWSESCGRSSRDLSAALLNLKCLGYFFCFVLITIVKLFLRPFGYYLLL